MFKNIIFISLYFFIINLQACKTSRGATTDLKVTGGVEDNEIFPSVVGFVSVREDDTMGVCTGTVVRDDLLLTAAHCLVNKPTHRAAVFKHFTNEGKLDGIVTNGVTSFTFVTHPSYDPSKSPDKTVNSDIAFIIFPRMTFASYPKSKIASNSVAVGDQVSMVGYGSTGLGTGERNFEYKRFFGRNRVSVVDHDYADAIMLTTTEVGMTTSAINSGDSGGPLFNVSEEIVGIASIFFSPKNESEGTVINKDRSIESVYVNVTDPGVAAFIEAVMSDEDPTPSTGQDVKATPIPRNESNKG